MDVPEQPAGSAPQAQPAADRTRLATLSLRIGAVMMLLLGGLLALRPFFSDDLGTETQLLVRNAITWSVVTLCIGLAAYSLMVVQALRRRKRWGWISAVVLCVLYLLSVALLPLGAMGLVGLFSAGTRARFEIARRGRERERERRQG